jgi:predicted nucleic acid-binding protein
MSTPTLVVDASVALKWILPEEGHQEARRILESYQDEQLDLVAPHLLVSEVGNVLWKRVRRGDLDPPQAQRCFEELLRNCPILLDSAAVHRSAVQLAIAHGQTVYDCLYLAWALEQRCDLVTADAKFSRALGPAFPCIRLLHDFAGWPDSSGGVAPSQR